MAFCMITDDGNIAVFSGSVPVWSSNVSMAGLVNSSARILPTGNLVLTNVSGYVVWQSFDYPTDTGLPGMKFRLDRKSGLNRFLTSWESNADPARGEFSIGFEPHGLPQIFLYKDSAPYYRLGPWNGRTLNAPDFSSVTALFSYKFINNKDEVYIIFPPPNVSIISRIVLDPLGNLQGQIWLHGSKSWSSIFIVPSEQCDTFSRCGPYAICNSRTTELCSCLPGFEPEDPNYWLSKCVEKRKVHHCGEGKGEGFIKLSNLKLPDARTAEFYENMRLSECEIECLKN